MCDLYLWRRQLICLLLIILGSAARSSAYDLIVAKDGTGNYLTVQAAIDAAPTGQIAPYTIFIKNGKYSEKISIPSNKPFLQLIGESVAYTILSWNDYTGKPKPGGGFYGTGDNASVTINAANCAAMNITFENTTGDAPQALAISVAGDKCAFKNCRFLGGQDTILATGPGNRQYFRNCYVDGVVDFIFGNSIAIFDTCVIYPRTRLDNGATGYVTAANTQAGQTYGYVFRNCIIPNNRGTTNYALGRPWQNDGTTLPVSNTKVVFLNTKMSSSILPAGWSLWTAQTVTSLITYREYKSVHFDGTPIDTTQRLSWTHQMTDSEAASYYTASTLFGTWDPCTVFAGMCTSNNVDIAVSNFRGVKGASTSAFTWNISWPIPGVTYEVYRSSNNVNYTMVNSQTSVNDTAINFGYTEAIPPPGATYYYTLKAYKAGFATHNTDTLSIISTPTITVLGSLGGFLQGVGTPSGPQSYVVSGANLTDNITITPPVNYQVSSDGGINWYSNATPLILLQSNGIVANTSISVRLNASAAGTYSGNIVHTSTGAATVNMAVTGTVQSTPLATSVTLEQWPLTANNADSAAVRATGITATTPTLTNLYLSNGTTVAAVPAYSALHGQAFGASSTGDGLWTTASPTNGPGGTLDRKHYEQFTVTAASTHTIRVDSLIASSSFYNTSSNTKLAIVYSKSNFVSDSADVIGAAFTTPIALTNETAGTTVTYRLGLAGSAGVTLLAGQTLTMRMYFSCGSGSNGRYGKLKNVIVKGLPTINPIIGDYQTHQSGEWSDSTTWERYNGTAWVTPAPTYPVYNNANVITILSGHTVTQTANLTNGSGYTHLTKIATGGQLIVGSAASLKIATDGTPATTTPDLQVDGTLTVLGSLNTNGNCSMVLNGSFISSGALNFGNAGDTVIVNATGVYQHNNNNTNIPNAISWAAGSTLNVTGITSNQLGIFKNTINYANIIWNCPLETTYYAFRNTLTNNVSGSFKVMNTGTQYISFVNASGTVTLPSGFIQTGGVVNFIETGTVADTLAIGNDFNITGGGFNSNATSGSSLLIKLTGINKTLSFIPGTSGATYTAWQVNGLYNLASNVAVPTTGYGFTVNGTLNAGTYAISGAGDFTLPAGAILSSGATNGLDGDIALTGTKTLSTGANYIFNGSVAQTTGLLLPATVNSLNINNAAGVSLSGNVSIPGTLNLTAGDLTLGAFNLAANVISGGGPSKYVVTNGTGALKINNISIAATTFPVGPTATSYNPAILTNSGNTDNFSVNVQNAFSNAVTSPASAVTKQWDITPDNTTPSNSNLTVALGWTVADQGASFNPANASSVMHYYGSAWQNTAATITGGGTAVNPYFATASGFTAFSPFGITNNPGVLPLELISFKGSLAGETVKLDWETSSEVDMASFNVERSADGSSFASIGTVAAKNTAGTHAYGLTDAAPLSGVSYYRLKMINRDGSFTYSSVAIVHRNVKGNVLTVYPNPARDVLSVAHNAAGENASLAVYAVDGKKVYSQKLETSAIQTTVNISRLMSGKYLIVLEDSSGAMTQVSFMKY